MMRKPRHQIVWRQFILSNPLNARTTWLPWSNRLREPRLSRHMQIITCNISFFELKRQDWGDSTPLFSVKETRHVKRVFRCRTKTLSENRSQSSSSNSTQDTTPYSDLSLSSPRMMGPFCGMITSWVNYWMTPLCKGTLSLLQVARPPKRTETQNFHQFEYIKSE